MPDIVHWRGSRFDPRTVAMLQEAERISGLRMEPTQGSYNTSVSASAGSHDGGGAVDLSVRHLSRSERAQAVAALRRVGFAAWLRTKQQGFTLEHVHAIAVGCPDLSPLAARQVADYKAGRNGLKNGARDDGPRDWVGMTWETYVQQQEDDMPSPAEIWMAPMPSQADGKTYSAAEFLISIDRKLSEVLARLDQLEQAQD